MADDGNTTGNHHNAAANRSNPATPSRTPRRVRTTPTSRPSSSAATPPTATLPASRTSKRPLSATTAKQKSVICPICKKDMCHEKALCGHIRWHTHEERQAASVDIARALASNFVSSADDQGPTKRVKIPDLNKPPPPEDDDDDDG